MKPETQYTDLEGILAADVSDLTTITNDLHQLAKHYGIDTERYDVFGLDIYGVKEHSVRLLAVDKEQSTEDKEHLVKIEFDHGGDLGLIFKRLHIIAVDKYRKKYLQSEIDETIDLTEEE